MRTASISIKAGGLVRLARMFSITTLMIVVGNSSQASETNIYSLKFLRAKAASGDAQAQNDFGEIFYAGKEGVTKNTVAAVKWFRQAAEQNHPTAQYNLGACYDNGDGVAKDTVEAMQWYRRAADQNDARGQYSLGVCYHDGEGMTTNYVEAVKWYRQAAEQGLAPAQHNLGGCYRDGEGVATDYVEAVKWYRQAAQRNFAEAQSDLAVCYNNGLGVTQDHMEAYKWWLLAAAQGREIARNAASKLEQRLTPEQRAEGQQRAGEFKPSASSFLDPLQKSTDRNLPADLIAKASSGDAKAQNELGELFYAGKRDVTKNAVAALKWFRAAAEQNYSAAQANLAVCYERGDGVAKYEVEAYKWNLLAAAQGNTKAKSNVTMLELMLSPEQVAAGTQRSQAWLEQRKKTSAKNR